jgi:hypothetical protein
VWTFAISLAALMVGTASTVALYWGPGAAEPLPISREVGVLATEKEILFSQNVQDVYDQISDYLVQRSESDLLFSFGYDSLDATVITSVPVDDGTRRAFEQIAASHDVDIHIDFASTTRREYWDGVAEVVGGNGADQPFARAGLGPDGLTIELEILDSPDDGAAYNAMAVDLAARFADSNLKIDTFLLEEAPEGLINLRYGDTSPHKGGARIWNALGGECTSGFAGETAGGYKVMITAAHCSLDASGQSFYNPSNIFGTSSSGLAWGNIDAQYMLAPSSQTYTNQIYSSSYSSSSTRDVGFAPNDPIAGSVVTVSGSFGGAHTYTSNTSLQFWGSPYQTWGVTATATQPFEGYGDSGAPVYFVHTNGNVRPRGILTHAIAGTLESCWGGDPVRTGPECTKRILITSMDQIQAYMNISILY